MFQVEKAGDAMLKAGDAMLEAAAVVVAGPGTSALLLGLRRLLS